MPCAKSPGRNLNVAYGIGILESEAIGVERGQVVDAVAYGGMVIRRRLVWYSASTAALCREDEYEAATQERRQPVCVGFPLELVRPAEEDAARS